MSGKYVLAPCSLAPHRGYVPNSLHCAAARSQKFLEGIKQFNSLAYSNQICLGLDPRHPGRSVQLTWLG
jgi:hypothetical protein